MKIKFFGIENEIIFRQGMVSVLEIENRPLLRNVIFGLYHLRNENQSNMAITMEINKNIEPLSNFELITDILNLDLSASQAKLTKYIYGELEKSQEEYKEIYNDLAQIKSKIFSFLSDISFDLCYNEPEILDLIKDFNFKLNCKTNESILPNVLNFLKAVKFLKLADIVIFVDLKKYFSESELLQIYNMSFILDLKILLIESSISSQLLPNEWKLSIDDDLYESIPLEL